MCEDVSACVQRRILTRVTTRVIGSSLWEESKDAVDEKDEEECMPLNLELASVRVIVRP